MADGWGFVLLLSDIDFQFDISLLHVVIRAQLELHWINWIWIEL